MLIREEHATDRTETTVAVQAAATHAAAKAAASSDALGESLSGMLGGLGALTMPIPHEQVHPARGATE